MKKSLFRLFSGRIPERSRKLMRISLAVSDTTLAAALLIEVYAGGLSLSTYSAHRMAAELYRLPCAVLLFGWILAFAAAE